MPHSFTPQRVDQGGATAPLHAQIIYDLAVWRGASRVHGGHVFAQLLCRRPAKVCACTNCSFLLRIPVSSKGCVCTNCSFFPRKPGIRCSLYFRVSPLFSATGCALRVRPNTFASAHLLPSSRAQPQRKCTASRSVSREATPWGSAARRTLLRRGHMRKGVWRCALSVLFAPAAVLLWFSFVSAVLSVSMVHSLHVSLCARPCGLAAQFKAGREMIS